MPTPFLFPFGGLCQGIFPRLPHRERDTYLHPVHRDDHEKRKGKEQAPRFRETSLQTGLQGITGRKVQDSRQWRGETSGKRG